MASASVWTTRASRPSLTLGTHSRRGAPAGMLTRPIIPDREIAARRLDSARSGSYTTEAMPPLPVGKLRAELLGRIFGKHAADDARVVVGPKVGEDAAVLDMGDRYLVATTDPITFATDEIGWYALHVNANDVAVRGARPLWFLATLLLPDGGTSETGVERLFEELASACAELGVVLVGGHTEVTVGLPRPIVVGCMLGEVEKDCLVTTGGAQVGDVLLLTKGVPLEGAAILAREHGAEAERRGVPAAAVQRAAELLKRPGISVVPEARAACAAARVHAMHDPTEGGLVDRERVPVLADGRLLCEAFGLDPLGTIASGALLLTVAAADAPAVVSACRAAGVECAAIGRVTPRSDGVSLASGGHARPMPSFPQDEISKVLSRS